jgi:hypothetical protein
MLDVFAVVWRLHFMQKWQMENSITLNMIKWICLTYESASKKYTAQGSLYCSPRAVYKRFIVICAVFPLKCVTINFGTTIV